LKDNIKPLENVIDTVKKIQGVNFEWLDHEKIKNDPTIANPSAFKGKTVGFIAQDLEMVVPDVVWTDEEGYKSVDYDSMVAFGIAAVKEQQIRIDTILNRIKLLKEKING
jgi:hypothetical protein